jgi:hypothetical protein
MNYTIFYERKEFNYSSLELELNISLILKSWVKDHIELFPIFKVFKLKIQENDKEVYDYMCFINEKENTISISVRNMT